MVTSARLREAVVSATGMAALPSGRVYQVWVMSPAGAPRRPLRRPAPGTQLLASAVTPGDRIGITVEPAGGHHHPEPTTTRPGGVVSYSAAPPLAW